MARTRVLAEADWICRIMVGNLEPAHICWYRFIDSVGSPQIRRLRRLGVLTHGLRRGAYGANEPRSIAKLAGCDGDGS